MNIKPSQETKADITTLVPDPKNPRRMKEKAKEGLAASLELFGALDIVFNTRTSHLVSGHQRVKALKDSGAKEFMRAGDWGYIEHPKTGERFPVRFVDWDKEQERAANLAANNPFLQGEFTPDALDHIHAMADHVAFEILQFGDLDAQLMKQFDPTGGLGNMPGPGEGGGGNDVTISTCPKCGFRYER